MNYLDKDGLLYLWGKFKASLATKVDKVDGKGLSTNDFTTAEKTKLSGINAGAQANVLENVMVNGTTQAITSKSVNIVVPTKTSQLEHDSGFLTAHQDLSAYAKKTEIPKNVSDLANDNGYLTTIPSEYVTETELTSKGYLTSQALTNYALKESIPTNLSEMVNDSGFQTESQVTTLINNAVGELTGIDFQVVSALPSTGVKGVIYLMEINSDQNNVYEEYIWVNAKWEKIGTTSVDLSGYVKTTDLKAITNAEIDTLAV